MPGARPRDRGILRLMERVDRFYQVLVAGAFALSGCSGSPSPVPDASPPADDAAVDADTANCCPAECATEPCTCMGEDIACCWLVVHPLCDNLCQ